MPLKYWILFFSMLVLFPLSGYTQQAAIYDGSLLSLSFDITSISRSSNKPIAHHYFKHPTLYTFHTYDGGALPQCKEQMKCGYLFRSTFQVETDDTKPLISLYLGAMDYPYRVYINARLIHQAGRFENHYNSTIYRSFDVLIPLEFLYTDGTPNEIIIEALPIYEHLALGTVIVGGYSDVSHAVFWRNFFNVNMVQGFSILSFAIMVYMLFLIFMQSRRDITYVFFILACAAFICSFVPITFHFNSTNEILLEKVSRIGMPLGCMILLLYIVNLFDLLQNKLYYILFILFLGLIVGVISLQGTKQDIRFYFELVMTYIAFPSLFISILILGYQSIRKRKPKVITMLISFTIMVLFSFLDFYTLEHNHIPYCWLSPYSFMLIILSMLYITASDYSQTLNTHIRVQEESIRHLKEKQRLVELNQQKNRFIGIAAHDMRGPLGGIMNMTETLLDRLSDQVTSIDVKHLRIIQRTSKSLLSLLNDLLDIAVIESGEFTLNKEHGNLKVVLEERIPLHQLVADKKGITLHKSLPDVPNTFFDPHRISQVIDNVLSNAIKYSPPGFNVSVSLDHNETSLILYVQDEGEGMTTDEINRLFQEFRPLGHKPTGGESSTGLGLSIIKKITDAHQGTINVESKVGEGTMFTVYLPLDKEPVDELLQKTS